MWHSLSTIFSALSLSPDIRVILLSGAGRAFTAGLDVQAASSGNGALSQSPDSAPDVARTALRLKSHILEFQACISTVEKCPKPVVCVMHGISYGLALDLSLCADVRFSTQDTKFSVKEVDIGIAADIGTLTRLPHSVGNISWAKEVALSARVFGSDEALQHGLVSRVYKDKGEAVAAGLELCKEIASKSPVAVVGTKELMNYSRDHTIAEGLNYTAVWNAAMLQTQDVKDAMMSGLQKRKPTFSKL
jgi:delta(3,5)-delta(2,4)-dienoyl-CoA isomerase